MVQDICDCGQRTVRQGYCEKCLREYEIHLQNELNVEQFILAGAEPRTIEDLETEKAITESLEQEPVIDQKSTDHTQPRGQLMTEITDVAVWPYNEGGSLKAYASITLNGDFVIKSIRLIEGRNGLFLGFPENYKGEQGYPICFPITASLRETATRLIIEKYEGVLAEVEAEPVNP